MKKIKKCTICGKQFGLYDKYADLCFEKKIGYGSVHDGKTLQINLCCECFDKLADFLTTFSKGKLFK